MKRTHWILTGIVAGALLLRLGLLLLIDNPGLHDQAHYYNVARHLLDGSGLTIDYVWHYSSLPETITHPIDHWMPLTAIVTAAGMYIGGVTPHGALIPFIIAGSLLPVLVYVAARQMTFPVSAGLLAAALAAVVPDFVWNSLRTDTTILNMWFAGGSMVLMLHMGRLSLRPAASETDTGSVPLSDVIGWAIAAGGLAGLAYLTRNDSILLLPLLISWLVLHRLSASRLSLRRLPYVRLLLLFGVAFLVTIAPWLWRNWQLFGRFGTPESSRMFFMTDTLEHYAYNLELSFASLLERQTLQQIVFKRLFELAAAFKQIIISPGALLIVLIVTGGFLLVDSADDTSQKARAIDWPRLLLLALPGLWLAGILIAYPLLLPYKSQSGSFEKAYLTVLPLWLPLAGFALAQLVQRVVVRRVMTGAALCVLAALSFDTVRAETQFANTYYEFMQRMVTEVTAYPDVTGDGEIRMMAQDPYVLSILDVSSVMVPLASREDTLAIADRYAIDYLMLPAARPALDGLHTGVETDPRFEYAGHLWTANQRRMEFYALYPSGESAEGTRTP